MLSICVVVVEGDWVLDCFLMVFWGILLQLTFGFAVSLLGWTRFFFLAASTPNPGDRLENLWALPCGELPHRKPHWSAPEKIDNPLAFLAISLLHLSI